MARVEISGEFNFSLREAFATNQGDFFTFFIGSDAFTGNFSERRYSLESDIVDQGEIARETSIIKGDLSGGLLFRDRKVRSVKLTREFADGQSFSVKIDQITGLNFEQFTDLNTDSLARALRKDDVIIGSNGTALLTGFRGDDQIFLASDNIAFGGAGNDEFLLSQNTRNAQINDFNPNKDFVSFSDDLASNFEIISDLGVNQIINSSGDIIATIDNPFRPNLVRNLTNDIFVEPLI